MKKTYHVIDHTADFGLQIFGADAKELFINAALALFDVITETDVLKGRESCDIKASGEDWSDLMINWLREILYLWNGKDMLLKSVRIISLDENKISAKIYFDAYLPKIHTIKTEIKAVTYHQIQVKSSHLGWEARVIFDI